MRWRCIHMFSMPERMLPDEERIEMAKSRAAKELAKEIMRYAQIEVDPRGNVTVTVDI